MTEIRFTAYGDVQPAHRPRAYRVGNSVRMHNDKRHDSWMASIQAQALAHRPSALLDGPLAVSIDIYLLRPKSVPKKRPYPTGRPDCSNYVKAVEDALNRVLWVDDARIVELSARKLYGDPTRVEVSVREIG